MLCATTIQAALIKNEVDWPAMLGQHDMIWESLPKVWQDAPHFGNAMIGSMLYQQGDGIRLQVFRSDVQDEREVETHGWAAYSRPLLNVGHFTLNTVGKPIGASWQKDLWNAELRGEIKTDRGTIGIRHYVHANRMIIATVLTPSEGERGFTWSWHPGLAKTTRPGTPTDAQTLERYISKYGDMHAATIQTPFIPNPAPRIEQDGEITVSIQDLVAGGGHAVAWLERAGTDGTRTHIASIAKTFPEGSVNHVPDDPGARQKAVAEVAAFAAGNSLALRGEHRAWWHAYYPRSFISIPDPILMDFYWSTVYRMACNSRAGRSFTPTAGIWFQGGGWNYKTMDWNIQSSHWMVYAANRLEQGAEVVHALDRYRENLIRNVRPVEWQENSAFLHTTTSAWDFADPRGADKRYTNAVGLLPWVLHNAWWQYRFSMDESMLRETIYPLLRRSVNFYLHLLRETPDGALSMVPTYSPETRETADCAFDLALLRWGCQTLLEASERLGIDDPLRPRWQDVLDRLVDYHTDERGFRLGRDHPAPNGHRHFSHGMMIYPLYLVTVDQPEQQDVIERTLRVYGNQQRMFSMVAAHLVPALTAFEQGDEAYSWIQRAVRQDISPSGLWTSAGNRGFQGRRVQPGSNPRGAPVIESSLAVANSLQTMLLQSWGDTIRVFPAMPTEPWPDAVFHDLRAEGAFLVSARRAHGQTQWVRVKSLAGEPCRIRPGLAGTVKAKGPRADMLTDLGDGRYAIDLRQDEAVLLYTGNTTPTAVVNGL